MSNPTDDQQASAEMLVALQQALANPQFPIRQSDQWKYMFYEGVRAGVDLAAKRTEKIIREGFQIAKR